jgi:hypothetical protein
MTDEIGKLRNQVDGLIHVLFSLAHDLARVEPDCDLKATLQSVGVNLKQLLIDLNDGRAPIDDTAIPIPNSNTTT